MQLRLAAEGFDRQLHGRGTGVEEAEDRQRCGGLEDSDVVGGF